MQSVHRALDLLEIVARNGEAGVGEVAEAAGLRPPTAHNLLRTLTVRGYLLSEGGRYRLGPGVVAVNSRFDPMVALPSVLRPALEQVSAATGLIVVAVALLGDRLQALTYAGASAEMGLRHDQWAAATALDPAAGRVLVANTDRGQWDRFIEAGGGYEPDWTADAWRTHLEGIRETGVAVMHDPRRNSAVGVPVWAGSGRVVAAVGASMPGAAATVADMSALLTSLWQASCAVAPVLGCPQPPLPHPSLPPVQGL